MLYVIVSEEDLRAIHIPGFPGSRKNIPDGAISLCGESCITSRCSFHKKNPGECGKENELLENYKKNNKFKKIIENIL